MPGGIFDYTAEWMGDNGCRWVVMGGDGWRDWSGRCVKAVAFGVLRV